MPCISCNAQSCTHNKNNCCCLSNIKVGGKNAKHAEKTNCANFCECSGPEDKSESACMCNSVDCEAEACFYNDGKVCTADRVDIIGADAEKPRQTECYTFRAQ